MNPFFNGVNPDELLDDLRECAHKLLLAYNDTLRSEFWDASAKAAEACEYLMPLLHIDQTPITYH